MSTEPPPVPPPFGVIPSVHPGQPDSGGKGARLVLVGCALIALVAITGFFVIAFEMIKTVTGDAPFGIFEWFSKNEIVTVAVGRAVADSRVSQEIGTLVSHDWSGKIRDHPGDGSADVIIKVKGQDGSASIKAVATKNGRNEWSFSKLEVTIAGTRDPIDLIRTNTPAATSEQ